MIVNSNSLIIAVVGIAVTHRHLRHLYYAASIVMPARTVEAMFQPRGHWLALPALALARAYDADYYYFCDCCFYCCCCCCYYYYYYYYYYHHCDCYCYCRY